MTRGELITQSNTTCHFFISILIMTKLVELFGGRKKVHNAILQKRVAGFLLAHKTPLVSVYLIGEKNPVILEYGILRSEVLNLQVFCAISYLSQTDLIAEIKDILRVKFPPNPFSGSRGEFEKYFSKNTSILIVTKTISTSLVKI